MEELDADTPPVQRDLALLMNENCHPGKRDYEAAKRLFVAAGIEDPIDAQAVAELDSPEAKAWKTQESRESVQA